MDTRTVGITILLLAHIAAPAAAQRLDPLVTTGSVAGSAAGVLGGAALGSWAANQFRWDCCGDDPGLPAAMVGSLAGSLLGTALGGELTAQFRPAHRGRFGDRLVGATAGVLVGGLTARLVDRVLGTESPGPLIVAFSIGQGVTSALMAGAARPAPRRARHRSVP